MIAEGIGGEHNGAIAEPAGEMGIPESNSVLVSSSAFKRQVTLNAVGCTRSPPNSLKQVGCWAEFFGIHPCF
ncbi:MAG: hypothetical protein MJA27_23890 [Pseudanabaenales cyanobacterium]|nr:hypothetical protein [Pseudanabaenales cyanobacterium]